MADIQLVETSLRDGNQCRWAALGIDTARTLTIAPVMDRVGFKAIDFTTSTHMGVAVRYKQEDPWELRNLALEPKWQPLREELQARLERRMAAAGDPLRHWMKRRRP